MRTFRNVLLLEIRTFRNALLLEMRTFRTAQLKIRTFQHERIKNYLVKKHALLSIEKVHVSQN